MINISAIVSSCVFDTELHHEFIHYLSRFLQIHFYEDFTQLLLSPNKCEQIKTLKIFLGISMKTGHCSKQMWSHDRIDICTCRCVYTCLSLRTACFAQMLGVVDAHSPTLGLTEGHFEICTWQRVMSGGWVLPFCCLSTQQLCDLLRTSKETKIPNTPTDGSLISS